ncbi:hypothetical protein JW948_15740 [bacterium]|nr:hypothetical protein [bacterium]
MKRIISLIGLGAVYAVLLVAFNTAHERGDVEKALNKLAIETQQTEVFEGGNHISPPAPPYPPDPPDMK